MIRKVLKIGLIGLIVVYLTITVYHRYKPLPQGLALRGDIYSLSSNDVSFLADITGQENGERIINQEIFDAIFRLIEEAEHFIILDFFLYNDFQSSQSNLHHSLSDDLTQALIRKKVSNPNVNIVFISDPINNAYGGAIFSGFEVLRQAGIQVVITDLTKLRDSNLLYSGLWRLFIKPWGNNDQGGLAPHPLASGPKVTIRSWLNLFNFKANHRKLIITDNQGEVVSLITSANPHDGSDAHNNVALLVRGGPWPDLLSSEQAILNFSDSEINLLSFVPDLIRSSLDDGPVKAQVLTESAIADDLKEELSKLKEGDKVQIAMFYFSNRQMIEALKVAAGRGVKIKVLLDPNKDAFGYTKSGIPNRQVAAILNQVSNIDVRWFKTDGEQFHTKMVNLIKPNQHILYLGSANLTKRNIDGFNLETDLKVWGDQVEALKDATDYFNQLWDNQGDRLYSLPFYHYEDQSKVKMVIYPILEFAGWSTF